MPINLLLQKKGSCETSLLSSPNEITGLVDKDNNFDIV